MHLEESIVCSQNTKINIIDLPANSITKTGQTARIRRLAWLLTLSHIQYICSRRFWKCLLQNMEISIIVGMLIEQNWKYCGKRRNWSFWAMYPFVTMFSKVVCCQCVCRWEMVNRWHTLNIIGCSSQRVMEGYFLNNKMNNFYSTPFACYIYFVKNVNEVIQIKYCWNFLDLYVQTKKGEPVHTLSLTGVFYVLLKHAIWIQKANISQHVDACWRNFRRRGDQGSIPKVSHTKIL